MPNNTPDPASSSPAPYARIAESLDDAERLLKYAAETGVEIDAETRDQILRARTVGPAAWDEKTAGDFLIAFTELATDLKPVTALSLKVDEDPRLKNDRSREVGNYKIMAICLGLPILVFSFASFMTTALSNNINAKIEAANGLDAQLRAELGTAPDMGADSPAQTNSLSKPPSGVIPINVITELQQYASEIREINSHAKKLNWFVGGAVSEYYLARLKTMSLTNEQAAYTNFQLQVGLTNLWEAESSRTALYQHVRTFAQDVVDDVSSIYGGVGRCVLPMFYALLGTCAYFLHTFEQQIKARAYVPPGDSWGHFITAGICGAVVGLFNITMTEGVTASPLAVAFLAGYSVDVFFTFLESLLQVFTKGKGSG